MTLKLAPVGLLLAFAFAPWTMGQDADPTLDAGASSPPPPPNAQASGASDSDIRWNISTGAGYVFETGIDGGGDFSRTSAFIDGRMDAPISRDWSISLRLQYEFDYYDFKEVTGMGDLGGAAPWRNVHTITAGVFFNWDIKSDVTIFAGPLFQAAGAAGTDWGDALKWGGAGGVIWAPSPDFRIGIGIGALTQPEDNARFYPIIILDWEIASGLRISSVAAPSLQAEMQGIELVWQFTPGFELAGGFSYYWQRFRLDEDGPISNGVGQENGFPLYVRLSWEPSTRSEVSFYVGVIVAGELRAEDSGGMRVGDADYDPAAFVGLAASFSF